MGAGIGLYMAQVAKSIITPGQNKKTSATNAPTRILRCCSPGFGLVRWYAFTLPPKTVAQLDRIDAAKIKHAALLIFFMSLNCDRVNYAAKIVKA
jgi:hypothetical protein